MLKYHNKLNMISRDWKTMKLQLLIIFSLFILGSAWNQPSTCFVRQSACSGDSELKEDIRGIRESLVLISTSLQQLGMHT